MVTPKPAKRPQRANAVTVTGHPHKTTQIRKLAQAALALIAHQTRTPTTTPPENTHDT